MGIIDLLFPKKCLECHKKGRYLCSGCVRKVRRIGWVNRNTFAVFRYEGVIRKGIIALKYKYSTEVAKELATVCLKKLKKEKFPKSAVLVPIPLHWHRENVRGFNQAGEVGKRIAKSLGWQFLPKLLIKERRTLPQVELKGTGRRQNLKKAFKLNPEIPLSKDRTIILFDDVMTTGSTLREAAKTLESGGRKEVVNITIAK